MASSVALDPVPAITGTRPFAVYDCQLDDALVLIVSQRRALACRSDRHETVRALADLPFDDAPEGFLVELAVSERRDQCRERSLEHVLIILERKAHSYSFRASSVSGKLLRRLAIAASCGILRRLVPRRAAWYFCGALAMVESPRLVGRDIRTLLCAPQPSRDAPPVEGQPIARRRPGSHCRSVRRSRRDRLTRGWRAAGRRRLPACLWTQLAPSRALSSAQAATTARRRGAPRRGHPRPNARPPTWRASTRSWRRCRTTRCPPTTTPSSTPPSRRLAPGDVEPRRERSASQRQRSARPHAHRVGAAAPRQGASRRLPQVPVGEPRLAEPRATAAAHGRDAVRGRRRHRRHRHLLHRTRSAQPRRHGRARLGAPRARREGASEGSRREDLAREGSSGRASRRASCPASARCSASRTTSGASIACWART